LVAGKQASIIFTTLTDELFTQEFSIQTRSESIAESSNTYRSAYTNIQQ
jgi:hypothetical protein